MPTSQRADGGRKPRASERQETVEALAPEAIAKLAEIMRSGSTDTAKIAACNALLDRAYGKARSGAGAGEPREVPPETRVTVRFV